MLFKRVLAEKGGNIISFLFSFTPLSHWHHYGKPLHTIYTHAPHNAAFRASQHTTHDTPNTFTQTQTRKGLCGPVTQEPCHRFRQQQKSAISYELSVCHLTNIIASFLTLFRDL